jgi:glycosyltransferase involved in cell wall biosynthesis
MGLTSLHITNAYHPTSGGIRTFYTALLEAAGRERRCVRLVVPGPDTRVEEVNEYARIYFVRASFAPVFDRRYRLLLPWRFLPGVSTRIVSILERERPDLVEMCDKYSLPYLAAMLRKGWHPRVPRPVLAGLTCERFDDNMAAYCSTSDAARAFTRWCIRHIYGPPFDAHIANSEYTAGELRAALHDRPRGFIRVAPMGVHADEFGPDRRSADDRASLLGYAGGTEQSTLLLYAGRVSPEKNTELLLQTLRLLANDRDADYRLVIAGGGPALPRLRRLASEWGLSGRLLLCGNLDRRTLASCYASADVFVHPNARAVRYRTPGGDGVRCSPCDSGVRRGARVRVIDQCLARRANRSGVCRCGAGRPPRRPQPDSGGQRHRPSVQVERGDATLLRAVRRDLRIVDRCVTAGGVTSS